MILNVPVSARQATQSFGRAALEHAPDELNGGSIDAVVLFGDVPFAANDAFEETFLVDSTSVEGRCSEEHFVHQAAQCPVVDSPIVSSTQDDFWRKI